LDRFWFALDSSVPSWDPADYLTGALNYWQALQHPQWFSGQWWESFWQLSSKVPPLTYIATVPWLNLFGTGPDQSTLINLVFSAILLGSVYGLSGQLGCDRDRATQIGYWAAVICLILPGLYRVRLIFLTDYPLVALVALCFYCLTRWRDGGIGRRRERGTGNREQGGRKTEDGEQRTEDDRQRFEDNSFGGNREQGTGNREQGERRTEDGERKIEDPRKRLEDQVPGTAARKKATEDREQGKNQQSRRKNRNGKAKSIPRSPFPVPHSPFPSQQWFWAAAFGLSFGLALLVKQTVLFFLLVPLLWVGLGTIRWRAWGRLLQLVSGLALAVLVCGPWYSTNWLFVLTAGKRATVDSAIAEGDPALTTLKAWTYYWQLLPEQLTWPLLLVPLVGLLLYWSRKRFFPHPTPHTPHPTPQWSWFAVFLVGAYLLCSLNINKDSRYVLPYLPILSLLLASGLVCWPGRWGRNVRWGTVGLTMLLASFSLFPLGGPFTTSLVRVLSPAEQHQAQLGEKWPHRTVMQTIVEQAPYLRATLGVLPSTPDINQHNLNYYGALAKFQVYGRQVGTQPDRVAQDVRSLDWFVTKTGDQGSLRSNSKRQAQADTVQAVEQGGGFQLLQTWTLPDGSLLNLYHRQQPPIEVKATVKTRGEASTASVPVRLDRVIVPKRVPPGLPVPVTYQWSGDWSQLQAGLVLLTWQQQDGSLNQPASSKTISETVSETRSAQRWFHDGAIAMGRLQQPAIAAEGDRCAADPSRCTFQVVERTAMLPPARVKAGRYTLKATYLNRRTGETYTIPVPAVVLDIDPAAAPQPAPELDLVTQLRTLSLALPQGIDALPPIFETVDRIGLYDPIQDYTTQARQSLTYRLAQEPNNLEFAYNLVLATVLERDAEGAIAALEQVTQLDPKNPYARAYLAFVYLYCFRPHAAQTILKPALTALPNSPEIHALSGAATLMQGNLWQAWQTWQHIQRLQANPQESQ